MRLRPVQGLAWQVIDGEAVVLDLRKNRSLGLNETGALVWSLLPFKNEEEIAADLVRRFGIQPARAREDVARLIQALLERGLVKPA